MQCDWYLWYKISCIRAYPIMCLGYFSLPLFAKVKWNVRGEFSDLWVTAKVSYHFALIASWGHSFSTSPKRSLYPFVASSRVLQWTTPSPEKTMHSSFSCSSSHFCYYQRISHNFLCSQNEMDGLLSNSSLLTLCENPELGLLPCSFRKY